MDQMTSSSTADTVKEASSSAVEAARDLSGAAIDDAKGVAQAAKEEAREIVQDARQQTMHLLDEVRVQARDQAEHQAERLADSVAQLAEKVRALIEGRPEEAGAIRDQLQKAADGLESVSRSVRDRGAQGLIDGVAATVVGVSGDVAAAVGADRVLLLRDTRVGPGAGVCAGAGVLSGSGAEREYAHHESGDE